MNPRLNLSRMAAGICTGVFMLAAAAQQAGEPLDLLSFAQGALPVEIAAPPTANVTLEHALKIVDGDPALFSYSQKFLAGTDVVAVTYKLPATTEFSKFLVPNVRETPSPSQTFARTIEVHGAQAADGPFELLASGELSTHRGNDERTALTMRASRPVRWLKVSLKGGIDMQREQMFLEFSELIGHGKQEAAELSQGFAGPWQGRGVALLLQQDGPVVSGCYDRAGKLNGTVNGNILRATGEDLTSGVRSAFIALLDDKTGLTGVRSTNGAPFKLFQATASGDPATLGCSEPVKPVLACGAIIHGIGFDFDSAKIRPDSGPLLDQLYEGLNDTKSGKVLIEGHTSSEGAEAYNQQLSERRAAAVVSELVARGLAAARISSAGIGEARPIASNADESGRAMNRRVEVHCQ